MNNIETAARELLKIEKRRILGPLSDDEQDDWLKCAEVVFGKSDANFKRRSFRIPVSLPAEISIDNVIYQISIHELSLLNLTISCEALDSATAEKQFILTSINHNGSYSDLNLACRFIRKSNFNNIAAYGAEIVITNSESDRLIYFENFYFPAYLNYLKVLSST